MAKRRLKKPSPTPFLRWNKRSRRGVPAKSETNHRNANRSSVRKGLLSVHDGGPFCLAVILRLRGYWVDIVCEVNLGGYAKFHLIRFSAFRGKAENHLPLIGEGLLPAGMAAGFSSAGCVRFVRREGKGNGTTFPCVGEGGENDFPRKSFSPDEVEVSPRAAVQTKRLFALLHKKRQSG